MSSKKILTPFCEEEFMIKRYNIVEHSYGDGDTSMDVREDLEGQYVEYEDIKHLLQNTSSNSDNEKCKHWKTYNKGGSGEFGVCDCGGYI
jgi:hypothetical protein